MVGVFKVERDCDPAHVFLKLSVVDAPRVLHDARLRVDPAAVSGARMVSGDVARAILLADGQLQVGDGPVDVESRVIENRDHLERPNVST